MTRNPNCACKICGKPLYRKVHELERGKGNAYCVVHHIVRRSDGGSDELENLELVCPTCHAEIHYYGVKHSKKGVKQKPDNGGVPEPGLSDSP
jgi:5-methylcytosine-specific restriction endonuclease McrA